MGFRYRVRCQLSEVDIYVLSWLELYPEQNSVAGNVYRLAVIGEVLKANGLLQLERVLLLENAEIDLGDLRLCCSFGVPDSLRPLCWRLLLGYLPMERQQWPAYLLKQREIYNSLVEDVIVRPGQSSLTTSQESADDHPLNLNPDSEWNNYFKDNEVLAQIDKDVRRLCPEIDFFQRITSYPHRSAAKINLSRRIRQENLYSEVPPCSHFSTGNFIASPSKTASKEYSNVVDENVEYHWQVVERVLFMYSKLNPGVKYVQGMNEIMGPLYYVFASDADGEWAEAAEADTYYCFQLLMSEIKDNFIKTLDSSNCGIDVINIWDSLFSSPDRLRFLHWICLAMLEKVRTPLLEGDFTTCLKMLQQRNVNKNEINMQRTMNNSSTLSPYGGIAKTMWTADTKMSNEFKQGSSTTPASVNSQNNPTQGVATPQQKTVGRVQGSTPSGSISNPVTTQSVAPQFAVATPHSVTHNANPEVLSVFECPVCMDYMMPPYLQCQSGHLVCGNCRPKLTCCPTCRGPVPSVRNLVLEKIANTVMFPCKFAGSGCPLTFSHVEKVEHEELCEFRPYCCPCPGASCKWQGSLSEVMGHLMKVHKSITTLQGEDIVFLATDINLPGAVDWVMMQSCFGYHFMLVLEKQEKFQDGNQMFYAVVQLIGAKKESENFMYRLELATHRRRFSWEASPRSIHEGVAHAISLSDCMAFDSQTAQLFAENAQGGVCKTVDQVQNIILKPHYIAICQVLELRNTSSLNSGLKGPHIRLS
uniref:E3 ubiquitin-protein ligase n=1 Tax=Setaria digitata TaxID=48799 RepID=A0A915PJG2_9BILA